VWASWNGATDVARWEMLAGASPSSLSSVTSAPADGFETAIQVDGTPAYVAVRALDSAGAVLGTSGTTKP